ncbi:MAG: glutamine--fructose-6-phosphate aminotransferase, partial [Antricoccus sp.]
LNRRVAVVHNGIIENFSGLRSELEDRGIEMMSDTDTEVVAHLVDRAYEDFDPETPNRLTAAVRGVCRRLEGAFTLVVCHAGHPDTVIGARRNSPLVAGIGDGEYFLASDVSAFIGYTRRAVELGQDQIVEIDRHRGVVVSDFHGRPTEAREYDIDWDDAAAEKGGYDWFMLKEIAEQPAVVADTLRRRLTDRGQIMLDEIRLSDEDIRDVNKIFIVACGTSYYAGMVAKYAIEHWTRIPVEVELASEFRYRDPVLDRATLVIAISQSGETADTLMALRHAKEQHAHARILAICNTIGSTIPRESDAVLYTRAGVEIANILTQLRQMPAALERVLETMEPVRALARSLVNERQVLYIDRHVGYPVALEGALKLKELAYINAEGFAAGELKHGPIALIGPGTPVVAIVPSPFGPNSLHDKVISNIQECRARGARTIIIAEEGDDDVAQYADHLIVVPQTPVLMAPLVTAVPLQVMACEFAAARGLDVDQPRNLAKSVTVE